MQMKLLKWDGKPIGITIGSCYEITHADFFWDDADKLRSAGEGTWEEAVMETTGVGYRHAGFADQEGSRMVLEKAETALDVQVGGGHYKDLAIQPVEYSMKNNLNYCQANIVKYATRYKDKNGVEDLKKIKHYVDLIIELEYEGKE